MLSRPRQRVQHNIVAKSPGASESLGKIADDRTQRCSCGFLQFSALLSGGAAAPRTPPKKRLRHALEA
eukprot:12339223-Alexandrium_andersonii.AAC.1